MHMDRDVYDRSVKKNNSPDWGLYGFILGYVALICGGALLLT
jgi:hypothetical protein